MSVNGKERSVRKRVGGVDAGTSRRKGAPSGMTGVAPHAVGRQRVELAVDDLKCANCAQTVEQALRAVPGVAAVTINPSRSVAFVDHDPDRVSVGALYEALRAAGYRTGSARIRFGIRGMTCASCVTRIEQALRATPGVLGAHVSIGSEEALVEYVPATADLGAVRAAVASAGYGLVEAPPPVGASALDRETAEREYRTLMRQWWFGAAVGTFTMIMSYPWLFPGLGKLFPRESHGLWWMWAGMGVASLAVMLYSGRHFFTGASQALKHRSDQHAHADRAGHGRRLDSTRPSRWCSPRSSRRASSRTCTTT